MSCLQAPTATLFGTSVISTYSVSTIVSTSLQTGIYDGITVISTCSPAVVSSATTCVPTVYTTNVGGITTFTSLITTFETVPVVQTVTSPTQTLYTTSCAQYPDDPAVKTPPSSSTTTTTPYVVAPVTITRTSSSTDPSGNVIIATVAIVSTPSPDSTQSGSGSGGPNTPAIIGGAVGGVVVGLIALIGIIWFIKKKRRSGVRWDDIYEEDEGHQAGGAEVKYGAPAATNYASSPNHDVVGSGTPSPLLRGDQPSGVYSHSRSTSAATGYATHRQSNSQAPYALATSSPHSPPNSPPSMQQQFLPGAGATGLEGTQTPIWASPSAQQGYFHQGSPSDPNYTPTVTSTYNVTSHTSPATTYSTLAHTTANPVVAYPPAVVPPIVEGRQSTYNDHKPPLVEQSQQGSAGQPSQHQQAGPSGSTTKLGLASIDNSAPSQDAPPPAYQQ